MKNRDIYIDTNKIPNVLFLGNGMLRLVEDYSWDALLADISGSKVIPDMKGIIPYAMQPEVLCGTDCEEVQRKVAATMKDSKIHPLLEELLSLDFDAIITTNYTYEIESTLLGKNITDNVRKRLFTSLDGSCHRRLNTFICNIVTTPNGKTIPVFHIHGELYRKHSMILSYYSYAKVLSDLVEYNKTLDNKMLEHQEEKTKLKCRSWLDYFIIGNVYAVGFSFDTSEFDVWWAIERKDREVASCGKLYPYMEEANCTRAQKLLFASMKEETVQARYIKVCDDDYVNLYIEAIDDIKEKLEEIKKNGY